MKGRPTSTVARVATVTLHTLTCCVTAGVIIGYGQLYPLLVDSQVYSELCPPVNGTTAGSVCPEQGDALDRMFVYGAILSTYVQGPAGLSLDMLGPKFTALIGMALLVPGAFMFAFADTMRSFDSHLVAFVMMSAGGPWTFVSVMPTAGLFPKKQSMILMLLNGAYGGGAFVFFIFAGFYDGLGVRLRTLFIAYGVLCGALALLVLALWPMRKYSEIDPGTSSAVEDMPLLTRPETPKEPWSVRIKQIIRDVLTVDFMWHTVFTSTMIVMVNFYLSTSYQQLQAMSTDASLVNKYNVAFGALLPALGFLGGTPLGYLIDVFGLHVGALLLLLLHGIASGLALVPILPLQMLRFIIFSCYNPVVFGFWASFIVVKFGPTNYGSLFGVIAIAAGSLNFAANPINAYTNRSGNYFWVYVGFLATIPLFVWYPIWNLVSKRYSGFETEKRKLETN